MNIYFDGNRILTYNCLFNFIIGARGCGKTYYAKKRAVNLFLSKGKKFIYLRRYDTELQETAKNYFNDIILNKEFNDIKIEYKNGCFFINDNLAGYALALTLAQRYKSISFPDVDFIIFDEFLTENGSFTGYLKNEVKQFLNFYMSIDRYRGTTVFFLGNSTDMINPYFLYFDLKIPYNNDIYRKNECLVHMINNINFTDYAKNTRFGKLINNTDFSNYVIDNNFIDDNLSFIDKKSNKSIYYFTLKINDNKYGVWIDYKKQLIFVSKDVQLNYVLVYALSLNDHNQNTILIKNLSKNNQLKNFINYFMKGKVMFENIELRVIVTSAIKNLIC